MDKNKKWIKKKPQAPLGGPVISTAIKETK